MKFQLLIKIKMMKNKEFSRFKHVKTEVVFILLMNVKMPTGTISCSVELSMKSIITSKPSLPCLFKTGDFKITTNK